MNLIEPTLKKIQEDQQQRIKKYVSDYAEGFNMSKSEVLKILFPAEIKEIEFEACNNEPVRNKLKPKYINPDNHSETWAGRGLKPMWLVEKIKQGCDESDFLIQNVQQEIQ